MADGGCGNETRSALDGAFLLHLLRNPPQSQPRPPPPSLPHEFLHRDPAVAAFVPNLAFPHNLAPHPPRPAPQAPPPGFGRDHWAPPLPSPRPPGFSLPGSNRLNSPLPAAQFVQSPSLGNDLRGSPVRPQGRVDRSVVKPPGSEKWFRRMGNADASVAESSYWQNHGPSERKQSYGMKGRNGQWANYGNSLFPRPGLVEQGRPPGMEWKSRQQQDGNKREERSLPYSQRESMGSPPGGASRSSQRSIDGLDIAESLNGMQLEEIEEREIFEAKKHVEEGCRDLDMVAEQFEEVLRYEDENRVVMHSKSVRGKDLRIDSFRGHHVSSQRMRFRRRELECRRDIENFSPLFLSIYNSLTPADEEKAKQIQLLQSLGRLVNKEWPTAQLHLYGSCANSFGVSKSDIDVCLAIDDSNLSKGEILLKLADILESDNLQEVQALTHARVPIVKMMDPVTGISCDICVNNLLAVANTKLLRDYAQIDDRLRQLAFIVKHWAKSRGVNETYRGTLSSYAYVLMCIHFLQLRRPAILPCLQEMEATYLVTIEDTKCAYFDQVDRLHNFGARNKESIARLLWAFFHYWAYCHDYTNDVISVRTGQVISKRMKDWTRRIGNDRHLICIEDPFETSHDLGRVVDKYSIKILREEFERAADILQYDPNPSVTLFEPYIPGSVQNGLESDLNQ